MPEIKTSYKDIILGWDDIGKILNKIVEILGLIAIPSALFFISENIKEQEKKKKELKEFRDYIKEHIEQPLEEIELSKDTNIESRMLLITYCLDTFSDMLNESEFHSNKKSYIDFISEHMKFIKKSSKEIYEINQDELDITYIIELISLLCYLRTIFYLSDNKFESRFWKIYNRTDLEKVIANNIDETKNHIENLKEAQKK